MRGEGRGARIGGNGGLRLVVVWVAHRQPALLQRRISVAAIRSYRDLVIWKLAIEICKEVYQISRKLPKQEVFGLCGQMQRAGVSIPSNIAEGHVKSTAQFRNHLSIAMGSLAELETQLVLTGELYGHTAEATQGLLSRLDALNRQMRTLLQRLPQ
jgi:four helix bundle protein